MKVLSNQSKELFFGRHRLPKRWPGDPKIRPRGAGIWWVPNTINKNVGRKPSGTLAGSVKCLPVFPSPGQGLGGLTDELRQAVPYPGGVASPKLPRRSNLGSGRTGGRTHPKSRPFVANVTAFIRGYMFSESRAPVLGTNPSQVLAAP